MTSRRVRVDANDKSNLAVVAVPISKLRSGEERAMLIFPRLICRRAFEVRLRDIGELACGDRPTRGSP